MTLSSLKIGNFRNYKECKVKFSDHTNFIIGANAQGKTNLLEAIYLICLARSFRGTSDDNLKNYASTGYELYGNFISDTKLEDRINFIYSKENGKQIAVSGKRLTRFSELVGRFPVISLSSTDNNITAGPPVERRRFFDILLSQVSIVYFDLLREYQRILKQKNTILKKALSIGKPIDYSIFDAWNQRLVTVGSNLIRHRLNYINNFSDTFASYYNQIIDGSTPCRIEYRPNVSFDNEGEIEGRFIDKIKEKSAREIKFGTSLVGPHRDEFIISVNSYPLRKFGSRGEHKTALIALKGAELQLIINKRGEKPILLLDDLFSELDVERSATVSALFRDQCQTFISATSLDVRKLNANTDIFSSAKVFSVKNGTVRELKDEERF